jgi:hypothetical protein
MKNIKMNILKRLILIFLVIPFFISGCESEFVFDQRDRTFQDDPQVGFFPNSVNANDGEGQLDFEVQLIGEQQDSNVDIPFSVVSEDTNAEEGVHYEVLTSSPITIAANSSITTFSVNILDADMESGVVSVVFELQDPGGEITAAENVKTTTINIFAN